MTRLVLLNGAPGSGKSTLARRYADEHPLTLALDVDTVRGMLGGWLEQPVPAGLAARDLALAMARQHLLAGREVVVPQHLGRLDFVIQLNDLANRVGVEFVEVALLSDVEDTVARFARRSLDPQTRQQRDAAALQERWGGEAELRRMHQRLLEVVAARSSTRTVTSVDGEVDRTYELLLAALAV